MFNREKFYDTVEREGASIATVESNMQMNCVRRRCGSFVNSGPVQGFMILCIVINAIMMGIATYPFVRLDPDVRGVFNTVDQIFLILFTIELGLQLIYRGVFIFTDPWLTFDFCIILLSWAFASVQIVRAFRIFRALRLAGRIKPLRDVLNAILTVMPNLANVCCLLLIVFYIFMVVFTDFFKDMYKLGQTETNFFGSLDLTAFTLFQLMCMDDWSQVAREVMETYSWSMLLFAIYILITAFVFTNTFVAVLCDSIYALRTSSNDDDDDGSNEELIDIPLKAIERDVHYLEKQIENAIRSQERTATMIEFFSRQMKLKSGI